MVDEDKTRGVRKQATYEEGKVIVGAQAGERPQQPTPPQPAVTVPAREPLTGAAAQAVTEYQQISRELVVASAVAPLPGLQTQCEEGDWCLPDLNCSARDFRSKSLRAAFEENRQTCRQPAVPAPIGE